MYNIFYGIKLCLLRHESAFLQKTALNQIIFMTFCQCIGRNCTLGLEQGSQTVVCVALKAMQNLLGSTTRQATLLLDPHVLLPKKGQ